MSTVRKVWIPGSEGEAPKTRANQFAQCTKCQVRLAYIPRMGCHAQHRQAGPLSSDIKEMIKSAWSTIPPTKRSASPQRRTQHFDNWSVCVGFVGDTSTKGKLTKDVQQAAAAEPKTTTKEKDTVNVEESGEEENPADSRQCRELASASEEDSEAAKDDSRAAGVSKPILSNLGVFQHNEESRASGVSEPILNILGSCYRTQITNYDQIMGLCSKYIQEGKFDHHALENVVMSLSGNQVGQTRQAWKPKRRGSVALTLVSTRTGTSSESPRPPLSTPSCACL